MKSTHMLLIAISSSFAAQPAHAQDTTETTVIAPDLSKSFVFSPQSDPSSITATHIKVPGIGNYDINFKFNADTLNYEIDQISPSVTTETTESFVGWYVCTLYHDNTPIFSPMIKPVGNDLLVAGMFQYKYLGFLGENENKVWKYSVNFSDGSQYLLTLTKPSNNIVTAYMGFLDTGETELDLNHTLKCEKRD